MDNKVAGKAMPAVTLDGAVIERTNHLIYLGIHFDGMLTYKQDVQASSLKASQT